MSSPISASSSSSPPIAPQFAARGAAPTVWPSTTGKPRGSNRRLSYLRAPIACTNCRNVKERCFLSDGENAGCKRCIRLKKVCIFAPVTAAESRRKRRPEEDVAGEAVADAPVMVGDSRVWDKPDLSEVLPEAGLPSSEPLWTPPFSPPPPLAAINPWAWVHTPIMTESQCWADYKSRLAAEEVFGKVLGDV